MNYFTYMNAASGASYNANLQASKKKDHDHYKPDDYTGTHGMHQECLMHCCMEALAPIQPVMVALTLKAVPGVMMRITGGSTLQATHYNLERYRFNLCQANYTASLPEEVLEKGGWIQLDRDGFTFHSGLHK